MNICKRAVFTRFRITVCCLLFSFVSTNVIAKDALSNPQKAPVANYDKVLFLGNSFSFYNNGIHNHLGGLIRANGDWERGKQRLRLLSLSGGHIHEQLSALQATLAQDSRAWDAVVLQAHSNEAINENKVKRFDASLTSAIEIIKQHNKRAILFMTWAYKGDAQMALSLESVYIEQAKKHKVPLVPVGTAFAKASTLLPDVELYVPDVLGVKQSDAVSVLTYREILKHPSTAGTYLAACVFYASLYQQSAEGNPFTAGLDPETALALQKLSWQVVQAFNNDHPEIASFYE
jgi:hypothetical protein